VSTRAEHYRAAEKLLAGPFDGKSAGGLLAIILAAQAHATLACADQDTERAAASIERKERS
jgi:hypothetical protein